MAATSFIISPHIRYLFTLFCFPSYSQLQTLRLEKREMIARAGRALAQYNPTDSKFSTAVAAQAAAASKGDAVQGRTKMCVLDDIEQQQERREGTPSQAKQLQQNITKQHAKGKAGVHHEETRGGEEKEEEEQQQQRRQQQQGTHPASTNAKAASVRAAEKISSARVMQFVNGEKERPKVLGIYDSGGQDCFLSLCTISSLHLAALATCLSSRSSNFRSR
jgi:hypothetical protein